MRRTLSLIALVAAAPVAAETTRQLDAHEHGVGALNIAIEGTTVALELHAPGADIVGFEYAAESEADRAAVDAAVATLARPLDLFVLPAAAACVVTQASAALEMEDSEHGHDDHDHAEAHDHDHDHETKEADKDAGGHSEFHATYTLTCTYPEELTEIGFAYFDTFANARELEVQIVTASGAQAFEVMRDAPALDLRSLF